MWSFVWLLVAAVIGVLIFLALREGMLWYWKIDEAIQLLREIRDELRARELRTDAVPSQLLRFREVADEKTEPR
ncbi:hypothetical protein LGM79_09960 [Burkholderia multivorans]|nr:hypothetical protein [Burkholderia multivorans]MDN7985659.1 hypothetical protein [Burkholderia multivorans]